MVEVGDFDLVGFFFCEFCFYLCDEFGVGME